MSQMQAVLQDQVKTESQEVALSSLSNEMAPTWRTEPAASVLKRERLRGEEVIERAEFNVHTELAHYDFEKLGEEWDQMDWETYAWKPEGLCQTCEPRGARISTFARRLMALERLEVQRRKPINLPTHRDKRLGLER